MNRLKKTGSISLPVFFVIFSCIYSTSRAQRYEIGAGFGLGLYTGEFASNLFKSEPGFSYNLFFRDNIAHSFTVRYDFSNTQFSGTDAGKEDAISSLRGSSFDQNVTALSVMGEYNFMDYRHPKINDRFSPYIHGGISVSSSQPIDNNLEKRRQVFEVFIPFGGGFKWAVSGPWNIGADFTAYKGFNDILDGWTDSGDIRSRVVGNPELNDWFYSFRIMVSYTFLQIECPVDYND